ncbi:hypothetical protein ACWGR4_30170 [Embleya sp. NPDC055664]
MAELVSRRHNLGVQFYGRSGQEQYGLDIVERRLNHRRTLYQVKRYAVITPAKLRAAVVEYADSARPQGHTEPPRLFHPERFIVVTSAPVDHETKVVNELAVLQDEYAGDLDIECWGAEAISRVLRNEHHLVYAVFGGPWAKMYCGFDPGPPNAALPPALGLVDDPVAVLGLDALEADANEVATSNRSKAARLYGLVADGLKAGNFPGHATILRVRQAETEIEDGRFATAFNTLFDMTLGRVRTGERRALGHLQHLWPRLKDFLDAAAHHRMSLLESIDGWYERGCNPEADLVSLRALEAAGDEHVAVLCCLVLEQLVVDGWYDFTPPRPSAVSPDDDPANAIAALAETRELASRMDSSDPEIRARLACAVADAALTADAGVDDVLRVFGTVVENAIGGRLRHARGLVVSRVAHALGVRGAIERADNYWRYSILASSEHELYGDARGAMRASRLLLQDDGRYSRTPLHVATSALPSRKCLIDSPFDPAHIALEAAHAGRLREAFGDTRRYLWQSRLSGHLQEELNALSLFGDVLVATGQKTAAVEFYIAGGAAAKAVKHAKDLDEPADVRAGLTSGVRRRRNAAVQVVGAQAAMIDDQDVTDLVNTLMPIADQWPQTRNIGPRPEVEALKAIAAFGVRIPDTSVDAILALAQPALATPTWAGEPVANLLIQTYWTIEQRREDLATALTSMLRQTTPPESLWTLVANLPEDAREPLLPTITELADTEDPAAIQTLATWGNATPAVQLAARRACAALLRMPVGVTRSTTVLGTWESTTVDLLLGLLGTEQPVAVLPDELTADKCQLAGGVLYVTTTVVAPTSPPNTPPQTPLDTQDDPQPQDEAANTAASPPTALATAVALHLTATIEDTHYGAAPRAQSVRALRRILEHIPAETTATLVSRLAAVSKTPNFNASDLAAMEGNNPLSSVRINTGAHKLPGLAMVAAAEALALTQTPGTPTTPGGQAFVDQAVAASPAYLRSENRDMRILGALTLATLAQADPRYAALAAGLLSHPDDDVRALGVAHAPASSEMFTTLVDDPSMQVRAALARRALELPDPVRDMLAEDPRVEVRRTLTHFMSND